MPLRPCLDCSRLSSRSRCPACERAKGRAKRVQRPYPHAERVRRAATVQAWRDVNGELCPGWQVPPHPTYPGNPLTADHPVEFALSNDEAQSLSVLCRSCNSRKSRSVLAPGRGRGR